MEVNMSDLSEIKSIKTEIAKLHERVAAIESSALTIEIPAAKIELRSGERYAGLELDANGKPACHLILLPREAVDLTWDEAVAWAKEQGGELPTRQDQALLYANLKAEFSPAWHWSCEQRADSPDYAWMQSFGNGCQYYARKSGHGRARAVRSLVI
jgi:hypothetical protein